MESFLAWLSLCACVLLSVECIVLHLDGKGQRKALGATQAALASLQAQVAGLSRIEPATARRMVLHVQFPSPELPATDERTVESPAPMRVPEPVLDAFMLRIAHSAQSGVKATHCAGRRCGGEIDTICECPCASCDRRRTMFEQALMEVVGPQTGAEFAALRVLQAGQSAALAGRVVTRYRALQEAREEPAAHCGGAQCLTVGAATEACACTCEACRAALTLLVQAQREA